MPERLPTAAEMRRENLTALIGDAGGQAVVASKLGVTASQVSQWVKGAPNSKTGKPRTVGDESARRLEALFGRPRGWMDHRHGAASAAVATGASPYITLAQALDVVGMSLAVEMLPEQRAELAEALSAWARYAGRERYRNTVAELLAAPAAPSEKQHRAA